MALIKSRFLGAKIVTNEELQNVDGVDDFLDNREERNSCAVCISASMGCFKFIFCDGYLNLAKWNFLPLIQRIVNPSTASHGRFEQRSRLRRPFVDTRGVRYFPH
jgi:hypothetical protein